MFIPPPTEDARLKARYGKARADDGFLMNLEVLWAWRPDVADAFTAARSKLNEQTSLSFRERAVLVCATARALGDSYCALAWGTRLAREVGDSDRARLLEAGDAAELTRRERALARWAGRVVDDPTATAPGDVAALEDAGLSHQEIADATMFVAFRLVFSTVNDALGAMPDLELAESAPDAVRRAVAFGRPVGGAG